MRRKIDGGGTHRRDGGTPDEYGGLSRWCKSPERYLIGENSGNRPAAEIVELYGRRWRIETAFEQLKVRLSADVRRSHSPEGVRKEFAARCIALNVVHAVLVEATAAHHLDPMRISFAHAVRAILIFSPALACEPIGRLPQIYRAMVSEIAHHPVPERPGRTEPRAVRREHKYYPALRETRTAWRARHAA